MATVTKGWTLFNSLLSFTTSRLLPSGRKTGDEAPISQEGKESPPAPDVAGKHEPSNLLPGFDKESSLPLEVLTIRRSREITEQIKKIEKEVFNLAHKCKTKIVNDMLVNEGLEPIKIPTKDTPIVNGLIVQPVKYDTSKKVLNIVADPLLIKSNFKCTYCGLDFLMNLKSFLSYTRDHVIPKSRGGGEAPENKVACCAKCNSLKSDEPTMSIEHAKQVIHQKRRYWQETLDKVREAIRD